MRERTVLHSGYTYSIWIRADESQCMRLFRRLSFLFIYASESESKQNKTPLFFGAIDGNQRLMSWSLITPEFLLNIQYKTGVENVIAQSRACTAEE